MNQEGVAGILSYWIIGGQRRRRLMNRFGIQFGTADHFRGTEIFKDIFEK